MMIQAIDCVKEGDMTGLNQQEAFWQHELKTFLEQGGLNVKDELKRANKRKNK